MTHQNKCIRLTAHEREFFLQECPIPGCQSAAVCRVDYKGDVIGTCRSCDWVGIYNDIPPPRPELRTK
jgi:predicted nucleic-acid-binding Zn-ribbon protein